MTTRPTLTSTPEDASLAKWTRDVEGFVEDLIGTANLPSAPAEVKVVSQANSVKVTFRAVNEVGVSEYKIYRSTDKNFTGENAEHIATVTQAIDPTGTDLVYIDAESTEKSYYFVSAVKGIRRPRLEGLVAGFGSSTTGHAIGEVSVGGGSGGVISGFSGTPGSILFVDEDGFIGQDNDNFFYSQSFKVPVAGPEGISWGPHALPDVFLVRDGSDILSQRRGTNSQIFRVYETVAVQVPDITQSLLTSGNSESNTTVYTTASITPAPNKLILAIAVGLRLAVSPNAVPVVTGNGMTWVEIADVPFDHGLGETGRTNLSVFRALDPAPTTGGVTFTYTDTQARASFSIIEIGNIDIGGVDGANAIIQVVLNVQSDTATPLVNLSSFSGLSNATLGVTAYAVGTPTITPGSGFVEVSEETVAPEGTGHEVEFRTDNDTSVDWLYTASVITRSCAIELKNAASSGGGRYIEISSLGSSGESEIMATTIGGSTVRDLIVGTRAGVSVGAITATTIAGSLFDESDSTTYTFPSWTPVTGKVYIATVSNRRAPTTVLPTLAGNGITWTQEETTKQTFGGGENQITVFRGRADSPSTGTLIATFSNTQIRGSITVHELDNVDTGGTNGSNAIVQSAVGAGLSVNSIAATLGSFSGVNNATIGFCTSDNPSTQGAFSPGSGFGAFDPNLLTGSQFNSIAVEFRDDNDVSVDFTSAGSAGPMQIIGLELAASEVPTGNLRFFRGGSEIGRVTSTGLDLSSFNLEFGSDFGVKDTILTRDGEADTLALKRGTNNQTFRVYEFLLAGSPPLITQTVLLADGDEVDRTVYTTASINPTANKLVVCMVMAADQGFSGTVHVDSVTGAGLTWVEMVDLNFDTIASERRCLAIYRALGPAPSAGALTITLDSPGTACRWIIVEFDNIDTSGTNGSGAIVQSATNRADSGTSITATLGAFSGISNATIGCFGSGSVATNLTEGSGFTKISEVDLGTIKAMFTFRDDNDTTVDMSQSVDGDMAVVAFEIKNAISPGDARYIEVIGLGASGGAEVMAVTGSGATDRALVIGTRGDESIDFYVNDAEAVRVESTGELLIQDGDVSLPGIAFIEEPDTGFFRIPSDRIGIVGGGIELMRLQNTQITVQGTGSLVWAAGTIGGSDDVRLRRTAPYTLKLELLTNPGTFEIYNTFTDATDNELAELGWIPVSDVFVVGTKKGSGGGSARAMQFRTDELAAIDIDTSQNVVHRSNVAQSNLTEGGVAQVVYKTAHEVHTLAGAKTSDTTTISIPAGAKILGASFNVNTAVTDDDGDNTWSAAFITGASESLASGAAAAQNTKVNSLTADDEVATATTEIQFTANGSNFTAGVIEIVVYYMELTSLADV